MSSLFTQHNKLGTYGRTGVLKTRAGDVKTPTFMPDGTRGAVKSLTPQQVIDTGVEVVLANTYHLHLNPGEKIVKEVGGIHAFANREGPILTDSGGFQVFSLGKNVKISEEGVEFTNPTNGDKHFITPEKSMQIQFDLGADMIVAFDHLIGLDDTSHDDVKDAFDRTHRWLERCIVEFKKLTKGMKNSERPLLFGVVQGGLDLDLRKESLRLVQESDVDGIAIGGLSVGETREEMKTVLEALAPLYDDTRPRFLLGVGTPEDLEIAVENGIDMLDCVLPTRNARHGVVWSHKPCTCGLKSKQVGLDVASLPIVAADSAQSSRNVSSIRLTAAERNIDETSLKCKACGASLERVKVHLTNEKFKKDTDPIEEGCDCYACSEGFSKAFLRHQFKVGEPLAGTLASIHNLRYMMRLCEAYQSS